MIAPVAYLVVALQYADYDRWISQRTVLALAFVPVVTTVLVWTNQFHGLIWTSTDVNRVAGAAVFLPSYGPWYSVNLGYLYLATAVGLVAFGSVIVSSGRIYRRQAGLMFVCALVPPRDERREHDRSGTAPEHRSDHPGTRGSGGGLSTDSRPLLRLKRTQRCVV